MKIDVAAWMLECPTMTGDTGWILSWSQSGAGMCNRIAGKTHEKSLYTSDALLAVAEAVHKQTMQKFYDHIMSGDECDMPERIDLRAIINQLTGE